MYRCQQLDDQKLISTENLLENNRSSFFFYIHIYIYRNKPDFSSRTRIDFGFRVLIDKPKSMPLTSLYINFSLHRKIFYVIETEKIYSIIVDNNQQSRLIASLSYFISKISMKTLHDIVNYFPSMNQPHVFTPSDVQQFDT